MKDSKHVVILDPQKLRIRAASCFKASAAYRGSAATYDKARKLERLGRQFAVWADELDHDCKAPRTADPHNPSRQRPSASKS